MIYIGNNEISNIYIGTDKIYGIYVGNLQIYPTDIILTAISLENLVWVTNIPASGGTATKKNCTYSVIAYYSDGTTVDVTSEATITGSQVIPNTDIEEVHSAGTLTLTASYSGLTATGNVTVYQEAAESSDFSKKPLTFNILSAGTIIWTASNASIAKTIDYKLNNGAWVSITSNTSSSAPFIEVNSGDKLQFRGNNTQYATSYSAYNSFSGSTASFEAKGNIMSLIYGDNFKNNLTISSAYTFASLFRGCTKLVSAENLVLPATALAESCYQSMFQNCTSLTTAPKLPATTLANNCYSSMFMTCTSLTTAPELPATTLKTYCYNNMFGSCASLKTAPELPATTLPSDCYRYMFRNCTSLTTAPSILPATTLGYECYINMFEGCKSLTTAPELLATTLADYCCAYMFSDCTKLTTAPSVLPATTLKTYCYRNMFYGCKSLTTAPALPATTLANYCYQSMFSGCKSLTTAPELPATALAYSCYNSMFEVCSSLTTAPELPATTLKSGCYSSMFRGCTSLNYIKCLATDIPSSSCTSNWVGGVASTGTFVKASSMASWTTGNNGIPTGWIVEDNQEPLTFNILSAGTIKWTASDKYFRKNIDYKLNNGAWTSITSNTDSSAPTITVKVGDKIQFRGNNAQYANSPSKYNSFGGSTAEFEVEGNIMSLINSTDFATLTTLESSYIFNFLFNGCTGLTSAKNLILPATRLTEYCYRCMFQNCSSLTTAPKELPATTLKNYCYSNMFQGCTSLTTAPALPARTLADDCYNNMFRDCKSLKTAPVLPATNLVAYCYNYMFYGCTSLNYIKCLATDISAYNCTNNWVGNVAATGTFVKASSMTSWTTGKKGIPKGWTVQNA